MAPAVWRRTVARPRANRPRAARYRPLSTTARATPGWLSTAWGADPERMACPMKNAAKASASLTTSATEPNTRTLAARTTGRRGMAVSVARMVPVPYSALTTSAPRTPMASWPRKNPVRLWRVGSKVSLSGRSVLVDHVWAVVAVARTPMPITATAVTARLQPVERTDHSLVHSARAAWRRAARPAGRGPLAPADTAVWWIVMALLRDVAPAHQRHARRCAAPQRCGTRQRRPSVP